MKQKKSRKLMKRKIWSIDMSKEMIDALANSNNLDAEKAFNDAISTKVGDALENRRKELSGTFVKSVPAEENDEEN